MLRRPAIQPRRISLVPMIDVMLILLVFFMVTSTYLNLDMVPAGQAADSATAPTDHAPARTIMLRLSAEGQPILRGRPLDAADLQVVLSAAVAENSRTKVVILPSGASTTQSLVSVMDAVTQSGVQSLRILRIEALK